jgi:hypothetical protein
MRSKREKFLRTWNLTRKMSLGTIPLALVGLIVGGINIANKNDVEFYAGMVKFSLILLAFCAAFQLFILIIKKVAFFMMGPEGPPARGDGGT